jgi:hypothetical protein
VPAAGWGVLWVYAALTRPTSTEAAGGENPKRSFGPSLSTELLGKLGD